MLEDKEISCMSFSYMCGSHVTRLGMKMWLLVKNLPFFFFFWSERIFLFEYTIIFQKRIDDLHPSRITYKIVTKKGLERVSATKSGLSGLKRFEPFPNLSTFGGTNPI